jgi:hypothetical protein
MKDNERRKAMQVRLSTYEFIAAACQDGDSLDDSLRRLLKLEAIPSRRGRPVGIKSKTIKPRKIRKEKPEENNHEERVTGVRNTLKQMILDELTSLGGISESRRVLERVEERYRQSDMYDAKVDKMTSADETLLRVYIRTAFTQLQREQRAYIPKRATWSLFGRSRRVRSWSAGACPGSW